MYDDAWNCTIHKDNIFLIYRFSQRNRYDLIENEKLQLMKREILIFIQHV